MCGENVKGNNVLDSSKGSPPRVRGKRRKPSAPVLYVGITPACAGKTVKARANSLATQDHPRVCGENALYAQQIEKVSGSPPRVRGKLRAINGISPCIRITPACAGKTNLQRQVRNTF